MHTEIITKITSAKKAIQEINTNYNMGLIDMNEYLSQLIDLYSDIDDLKCKLAHEYNRPYDYICGVFAAYERNF
jgi:hypothetical protein